MTTGIQYVGIDVHQATLVIAVMDGSGRMVFESTVATKREAIEQVLRGLSGRVWVVFEEGTQAQWLYEVISPLAERVVACNPRDSRQGENKSDRIDARGLANKLRLNAVKPVYHNTASVRTLKELVRIYESLVSDGTRSKLRLKALFRGRAIATPGETIYDAKTAAGKIKELRVQLGTELLLSGCRQGIAETVGDGASFFSGTRLRTGTILGDGASAFGKCGGDGASVFGMSPRNRALFRHHHFRNGGR